MAEMNKGELPRYRILRSKLEMPRNNVRLISRPQLLEKMKRWLDIDLGLVVAPAGYAKSTTIAQWCRLQQSTGAMVAWLSLDETDREPGQFLSYLIAALSSAGVAPHELETGAEDVFFSGGISPDLSALLEAVGDISAPVILVLDDYHRLNSPKVNDLLRTLVGSAPPNLTVVVATRTPLPFDIGVLLAAGRANEIASEALTFTKNELSSVFPPHVGDEAISLLHDRTEGWPVAVQILSADAPTQSHFGNFHWHTGHIATYLEEQIVGRLPEELQYFLFYTAPLERFNGPLADAVIGRRTFDKMMAQLEPLNGLVVRNEGKEISYRYHHLLAEFLQSELRRRHGESAVVGVHRRASEWFEANGHMAEAVRHARKAVDLGRCASLVAKAGGWELILFGGISYLRSLLQEIPDNVAYDYPRILVAKAYLGAKDGLLAESRALVDAARNTKDAETDLSLKRDILNVGKLIVGYEDAPVSPAELGQWESQLGDVPSDDPLTRSILSCQLIIGELAIGNFAAAEHRAQMTIRTMREARTVIGLNYCYLHAGLAAMYQGRLKAAEAHFSVAWRMAKDNFACDPGLKTLSRLLTACSRHWLGEPANYGVDQARADLDQVEHYDGWLDIYCAALTVEAYQLGDVDGAIVRGDRITERRGLPRMARIVDSMRLGMLTYAGRGSAAMKLKQHLPAEIWVQQPFWWLPFLESRIALGHYYAGIDRSRAIEALTEGLECARKFGAHVHAVRLLISRALLLDISGNRAKAVDDLIEALTMAAVERIVGPFVDQRGLISLLKTVHRQAQDSYIDILVLDFANSIVARLSKRGAESEGGVTAGLSVREREVLEELANGRSNKEIARLLDTTEHTVKFHLKNVYQKLGAERRTDAVIRAKRLNLI